jgi:hypothetical protein
LTERTSKQKKKCRIQEEVIVTKIGGVFDGFWSFGLCNFPLFLNGYKKEKMLEVELMQVSSL